MLCWTNDALPEGFDCLDHATDVRDLRTLARLVRLSGAREVVELGSWVGMSTLYLAQPGVKVHAIDTWQWDEQEINSEGKRTKPRQYLVDRAYDQFHKNMGTRIGRSVIPLKGRSADVLKEWDRMVDMVFIDASHRYESVVEDLRWKKFVKPGGILCGHDYGVFEGVTKAVDRHAAPVLVEGYVWWKRMR